MKSISPQQLQRTGFITIGASFVLALIGFVLPSDGLINPAFAVGIAFVLALFGLFLVLRPFVPQKMAFIGAVASYLALVATTIVALNYNEEAIALGSYAIGFVSFLAILAKLFLLLGVSHVVFPTKSSDKKPESSTSN